MSDETKDVMTTAQVMKREYDNALKRRERVGPVYQTVFGGRSLDDPSPPSDPGPVAIFPLGVSAEGKRLSVTFFMPQQQVTQSPAPSRPTVSPAPPQTVSRTASCPPPDSASEHDPDPPSE